MGPVGLNIYGFRDKWSGTVLLCTVVPNDRCRETIGHLFLDLVELYKGERPKQLRPDSIKSVYLPAIPVQLTTDKGTETSIMQDFQRRLRYSISSESSPALPDDRHQVHFRITRFDRRSVSVRSLYEKHFKYCHRIILEVARPILHQEREKGYFRWQGQGYLQPREPTSQVCDTPFRCMLSHPTRCSHLFNWLWPDILQAELNKTIIQWNNHITRFQPEKAMPSGVRPIELWQKERSGPKSCQQCQVRFNLFFSLVDFVLTILRRSASK
jgi:hypothetical protein